MKPICFVLVLFAAFPTWAQRVVSVAEVRDNLRAVRDELELDILMRETVKGRQYVVLAENATWSPTLPGPERELVDRLTSSLLQMNPQQGKPPFNLYRLHDEMVAKRNYIIPYSFSAIDLFALYKFMTGRWKPHWRLLYGAVNVGLILTYATGSLLRSHENSTWFRFPFFWYYIQNTALQRDVVRNVRDIFLQRSQPGLVAIEVTAATREGVMRQLQRLNFKEWDLEATAEPGQSAPSP